MGTRGAYGFRINDLDKVTYNHFDSYPDYLGRKVIDYAIKTPYEMMKEAAHRIIMVTEKSQPMPQLINKYKKYADLNVSGQKLTEWYCLLRNTQGDLFPYNNDLVHMLDYHDFLDDSLFCEWAYIINIDTKCFEVYKGFNKNSQAIGRYARKSIGNNHGYWGVALIKEISLQNLANRCIDSLINELERPDPIKEHSR